MSEFSCKRTEAGALGSLKDTQIRDVADLTSAHVLTMDRGRDALTGGASAVEPCESMLVPPTRQALSGSSPDNDRQTQSMGRRNGEDARGDVARPKPQAQRCFEVQSEGVFDELVVDHWLHVEQMNERAWMIRVGETGIWVDVNANGEVAMRVMSDEHPPGE